MAYFDRFDICAAHQQLEADYNKGGFLQERPSNLRRHESTGVQLRRIKFAPGMTLGGFDSLDGNAKEIYMHKVLEWKLPIDDEQRSLLEATFVSEYLCEMRPEIFSMQESCKV